MRARPDWERRSALVVGDRAEHAAYPWQADPMEHEGACRAGAASVGRRGGSPGRWVIIAAMLGVGAVGCSGTSGSAAPGTAPPATNAPRVLAGASGAVPKYPASGPFAVTGPWDIAWTYDCSQVPSPQFFLTVYDDATHNVAAALKPVREQQPKGSGTVHEADSTGTRFIVVDSACPWTFSATAP